jgi:hypothetical protein
MGKRSNFPRVADDFYPTPIAAVMSLLPWLEPGTRFEEPCCGNLALVKHLEQFGHQCVRASDIKQQGSARFQPRLVDNAYTPNRHSCNPLILKYFYGLGVYGDALEIQQSSAEMFITNPPHRRDILHPLIENLSSILPTWLLIDADWMHTKQSAWYMRRCSAVASIGRVKWIEGSKATSKDNYVWMRFGDTEKPTLFYGRQQ